MGVYLETLVYIETFEESFFFYCRKALKHYKIWKNSDQSNLKSTFKQTIKSVSIFKLQRSLFYWFWRNVSVSGVCCRQANNVDAKCKIFFFLCYLLLFAAKSSSRNDPLNQSVNTCFNKINL